MDDSYIEKENQNWLEKPVRPWYGVEVTTKDQALIDKITTMFPKNHTNPMMRVIANFWNKILDEDLPKRPDDKNVMVPLFWSSTAFEDNTFFLDCIEFKLPQLDLWEIAAVKYNAQLKVEYYSMGEDETHGIMYCSPEKAQHYRGHWNHHIFDIEHPDDIKKLTREEIERTLNIVHDDRYRRKEDMDAAVKEVMRGYTLTEKVYT